MRLRSTATRAGRRRRRCICPNTAAPGMRPPRLYLGIALGTSGCRAMVVDSRGEMMDSARVDLPAPRRDGPRCEQDPALWRQAAVDVLGLLAKQLPLDQITALAIDGTSGTLLLCDGDGTPLAPALMYNDSRARDEAARIAAVAPPASAAHGASSALAKLLYLQRELGTSQARAASQAEWVTGRLIGRHDCGDENNCLKLGYATVARRSLASRAPHRPRLLSAAHTGRTISAERSACRAASVTAPAGFAAVFSRHARGH